MSYGYGSGVERALKRHRLSVPDAAKVMGYKAPGMVYKILRDDADPSLDALQRLADHINEPVGDLLPNSGRAVITDELRDVLAAISGVSGDDREEVISALSVNARTLANAFRRQPSNVIQFPQQNDRVELSDHAMKRLEEVMQLAGAEPRKAARGPEREVRFYGEASAGRGIEFFDDIPTEYRQIPQWAWKKGARGVFKAAGDSMQDVGIFDHDILFVKPTPAAKSGEIVICTVNKKVFVKKLRLDSMGRPIQLLSKNDAYQPINISPDDEVEFFGVVVGRTGDL